MSAEDDRQIGDALLATSLRLYKTADQRAGMRSGMMDAAILCDLIAENYASKNRKDMANAARRCGDAIEAMWLRVPADDTIHNTAGGKSDTKTT